MVQWLRLHASTAGGTGSIPGWGTKIPHAAQCGKREREGKKKKERKKKAERKKEKEKDRKRERERKKKEERKEEK